MGDHLGHNRIPDKGKRSRASMCESIDPQPFIFNQPGDSLQKDTLEMPIQTINYCLAGLWEARTTIDVEETRGYCHLSSPCHPLIAGLKVIGVQCQQPHWCCHCQTGLKAPGIPGVPSRWPEETGAYMKINLPFFKYEDAKDAVTYQSWRWDLMVYHCAGCRDCTYTPSICHLVLTRLSQRISA